MSPDESPQPKKGWYDLPSDPEIERFWDGTSWTDQIRIKKGSPSKSLFSPPIPSRKWIVLVVAGIVALAAVVFIVPGGTQASKKLELSSPTVEEVCDEVLSHDWYELNARQFKSTPDIAAREGNSFFIQGVIQKVSKLNIDNQDFLNKLETLATYLDDFSSADQLQPATESATKVDEAFSSVTAVCEMYGVNAASPVISEATENKSEVVEAQRSRIPSDYVDSGEGVAYKLIPSELCPLAQFGCTAVEMFAYRDCPKGVKVYGNLFNGEGAEVAVTDTHSDPLVAGQSTTVYLSTGLSTAATGKPSRFICE